MILRFGWFNIESSSSESLQRQQQLQVNGQAAAVGLMPQADAASAAPAVAQLTQCFNSVALNVTMFLFNAASTHVHSTHTTLHCSNTEPSGMRNVVDPFMYIILYYIILFYIVDTVRP